MFHQMTKGAAAALLLVGGILGAASAWAAPGDAALILTASNTATNHLLVFNSSGSLLKQIATQGQGGVAGNAGGIAAGEDRVAVVNFGSSNVTVFAPDGYGRFFRVERVFSTSGSPVSVAFGAHHLYVLTGTAVESHAVGPWGVNPSADGQAQLLHADGSAGQVGVLKGQLIITEKSNAVETVRLSPNGAITGHVNMVASIPSNIDTPLGLVTRGEDAYVTLAHADETSLVRNGTVLTTTGSGTQHAPCWLALDGPFLFSANSPSRSVSRYAVYGQKIVQDAAVAAQFTGNPTDIAYHDGLAAVIDSNATVSHVTIFNVDQDGNMTASGIATLNGTATNGVAIVRSDEWH